VESQIARKGSWGTNKRQKQIEKNKKNQLSNFWVFIGPYSPIKVLQIRINLNVFEIKFD